MSGPALVVLGGLPATGKSTIAQRLAEHVGALHLRIDSIEQAIRDAQTLSGDIGPAGYFVAQAVARDALRLGHVVIGDSVNGIALTRRAWVAVAAEAAVPLAQVAVVCSDRALHRRRAESRQSDIPGHALPDWPAIEARRFEPWEPDLTLDTARLSADEAAARIADHLRHLSPA